MESSASESVKNGYLNWNGSAILPAWLSREFLLSNGFDSNAELFMCLANAQIIITYFTRGLKTADIKHLMTVPQGTSH